MPAAVREHLESVLRSALSRRDMYELEVADGEAKLDNAKTMLAENDEFIAALKESLA